MMHTIVTGKINCVATNSLVTTAVTDSNLNGGDGDLLKVYNYISCLFGCLMLEVLGSLH